MKIRTLIVDDEPLARQRLRRLLDADPDIAILGECGDGPEAVAALRAQRPDLVFLDVQMPGMDGFGVLQALAGAAPPSAALPSAARPSAALPNAAPPNAALPVVIFVTAHDRYALKAFEVHALDYLLKPFDKARFGAAVARAKLQVRQGNAVALNERLHDLLQTLPDRRSRPERLVVKSGGRIYFVAIADIDWIEAAGNYVRLHVGKDDHLVRESLTALEKKLKPSQFVRVHRSTIVNLERVRELQPAFHGDYVIILNDGTELALSRSCRERLEESLGHTL
jgi:two-component system, LytTR family, response regulator